MNEEIHDQEMVDAVGDAMKNFDAVSEESSERLGMSYDEQCARAVVSGFGAKSDAGLTITRAVKDAKCWSMDVIHECFPGLPTVMLISKESVKRPASAMEALKKGSKARIVDYYYAARELLEVCPQSVACFIRTGDWGPVVVHSLIWAGDDSLRASIPRILIPARGDPGDILVIEARKTFVKFLSRVVTI